MCAWARACTAANADELRERADEAASLLAGVGNAYSLASLLCIAVDLAWQRGCDAEAAMYLDRAAAAARRLKLPHRWLPVLNDLGLAPRSTRRHHGGRRGVPRSAHAQP